MKLELDGISYNLIIEKKKSTKNTYIRVRDNLDIYVTTNYFSSDKYILSLVNNNLDSIRKMINKKNRINEKKEYFLYLGKKYDIVYLNNKGITIGDNKVFINNDFNIHKWYKSQALGLFKEHLDQIYSKFLYQIPYPSLAIRSMKTRWGVCNVRDKKITLNLLLIQKDLIYLDYVIVHELCHLLYPNHSKEFWQCVGENMPQYKRIRKELKHDE